MPPRLTTAVHALLSLLAAEQEGVRVAALRSLETIIRATVDPQAAASAVARARAQLGGQPSAIESVASAIEGSLGTRYSDSWMQALSGAFSAPASGQQQLLSLAGAVVLGSCRVLMIAVVSERRLRRAGSRWNRCSWPL